VTFIRAAHVGELRSRIDALRSRFGLAAYLWTDASLGAQVIAIKAVHITDLRTALEEAYAAAELPVPTYGDPVLGPGMVVRITHIHEVRNAVHLLEES
jgi:hypothetical protein